MRIIKAKDSDKVAMYGFHLKDEAVSRLGSGAVIKADKEDTQRFEALRMSQLKPTAEAGHPESSEVPFVFLKDKDDLSTRRHNFEQRFEEEAAVILTQAEEKARRIQEQAQSQIQEQSRLAQDVVHQAQAEAERIREEARKTGYDVGYKDGFNQGLSQFTGPVAAFNQAAVEVAGLKETIIRRVEKDILELTLAVIRKVFHRELESPETVLSIIRFAAGKAVDRESLKVRMCQQDIDIAKEHHDELLSSLENVKRLSFEPDPSLSRGSIIVESNYGDVESKMDLNMEEVERVLREQLNPDGGGA
ncbi:MAG: hypothetical protein HQK60_20115 [Deltaproteobacteria bacterium]|nr:hypothetical protein [Deltaproteobacteria bacterium]